MARAQSNKSYCIATKVCYYIICDDYLATCVLSWKHLDCAKLYVISTCYVTYLHTQALPTLFCSITQRMEFEFKES
jgi:hypothetical protein